MKPGLYMHFLTGQCYEILEIAGFMWLSYKCNISAYTCKYVIRPDDNLSFLVYIGEV